MAKISVLGPGGWGIALAINAFRCGHKVILWSAFKDEVEALLKNRSNDKLLSGIIIPEEIEITGDIDKIEGSDITIIAAPSIAIKSVCETLSKCKDFGIIVNASKGLEKGTLKRLSQLISDILPASPVVALSGPSHAEEVARKIPTSLVVASENEEINKKVQDMLSNEYFRLYTSTDIIGVELGGALKNVIAICAGVCDGLGLGDNTKAALVTRGLAEMKRLGVALGADERTFSGLAGIGDLVVTCTSRHSRNNRFGNLVGSGTSCKDALEQVGTVEGYYATLMAYELAEKVGVELPIINECYGILYEDKPVDNVVNNLMTRPKHAELL